MAISKRLLEVINSEESRAISDVGIASISAINPILGLFLNATQKIATLADKERIDR